VCVGEQVDLYLKENGVSRDQLAEESRYSSETVRSMIYGRRCCTLHLLRVADRLCRANGKLIAQAKYLSPQPYAAYATGLTEAEKEAIAIHSYGLALIPGLLQTEEYARALMCEHCPPLDDETMEQRLAARMARCEILSRKPLVDCVFVIHEAALRARTGGSGVMKRQLLHLLEMGKLRHVTILVLPFTNATEPALLGPMVLLETRDHEHLAYEEGQHSGYLFREANIVSKFERRYGMIRSQALSAEESAKFIEELAEKL
jgi:hypothetical protein